MKPSYVREQRGPYLLEAGAADIDQGKHWQPWVKLALSRRADGTSVSRSFDRLKPVFGTQEAALRYAIELGRTLADEGIGVLPGPADGGSALWGRHSAVGRRSGYRWRNARTRGANGSTRSVISMLAGIFAR